MNKIGSTLALVVLALASLSLPARAQTITLAALEQLALENRPELLVESAQVRRAAASIEEAKSSRRPQLAFGADTSLSPGGQLITIDDGGREFLVQGTRRLGESQAFIPQARYFTGLTLQAPLYDFGRSAAAVAAAEATERAASADVELARRRIIQAVRAAYLQWLSRHQLHAIGAHGVSDARARRERVEALIEEGARPRSDLALARSAETLARLEAQRALAALAGARLELEGAVGQALPESAEPDPSLLQLEAAKPAGSEDPTLTALERRLDAVKAEGRMSERATSPLLSAALEGGVRGQFDDLFPSYRVGVSFSVPLWDGGRKDARVSAAAAEADALRARADVLRASRRHERARGQSDLRHAEDALRIAEELLEISETRLREAEEGYELGARGVEAIADARAQLARAHSELVLSKVARADALLRLSEL